jgi:hypothetical protein
VQWVWDYFSQGPPGSSGSGGGGGGGSGGSGSSGGGGSSGALAQLRGSPVTVTRHAPLYLQHEGHSLTVVGVERHAPPGAEAAHRLLILDPGHDAQALREALRWAALGAART